jgi:hypothetical protein
MAFTRREFGQVALAGAPAIGALLRGDLAAAAVGQAPPKMSQWAGVQLGLNVPYSLGTGNNIAAEDLLKQVLEVGVGSLELRAQPVEHYLGSPMIRAAAEAGKAGGARPPAPTAEQKAEIRKWRLAAPTGKVKELRQLYNKAGVAIDILKVDDLYAMSPEELDYFFQMASDLGARAVSAELPEVRTDTKRIGAVADKHKVFMA